MKLLFISNFINHHQLPICNELFNILGNNFKFVACEEIPDDKLKLGYSNFELPYLIDGRNKEDVYPLLEEFDVLLAGSCPHEYMDYYIDRKKLIFIYSERIFKDGTWHKYSPLAHYNMYKFYNKKFNDNMYLLCASAYTSSDYNDFNSFKNACLKWGYFPPISNKSIDEIENIKKSNSIIWVGRFIDWKHPEQAINLGKYLKVKNYDFQINIIGDGILKEKLQKQINDLNLDKHIKIHGPKPFLEVRKYMEECKIFIFTSDFNEGWGAVLNEAMSSGCACISSYKAGSSLYLINNSNGIIYDNTQKSLNESVEKYLLDENLRKQHSKNAYETITNTWNYKVAATRLVKLSKSILEKNILKFETGPLSKAEIITNKKAKHFIK
ncbi:MAG: glycosyltransferase [Erysipelotrichaceae bacterium]|nr:glycosyltransferase [Erysipelotrichaceae bacterium]